MSSKRRKSCSGVVTCEIAHRQVTVMSHEYVMLKDEIRRDGLTCQDSFRGSSFLPARCAHDLESSVNLTIASDQWQGVVCKTSLFLILEAIFHDSMLDTTSSQSGVMACPDSRIEFPEPDVITCEAFCRWVLRLDARHAETARIELSFCPQACN